MVADVLLSINKLFNEYHKEIYNWIIVGALIEWMVYEFFIANWFLIYF